MHGNAKVTGGNGAVSLRSVEGVITVDKASGRVQATTVNEGIRITNSSGEINAETTNGDIFIDNAQTSNLEAFTVNGEVTFNGTIRDAGVYKLGTHNGDIRVGLGGANNATIFVRTFQGDFTADFPVQLPEGQNARSGSKRFNFTLGSGSARMELQSFGGDIVLARKAITSREEERERRKRMNTPMAPPAPPAPNPAPAPKPPKPPGFDEHEFAEHFAAGFEEAFGEQFQHDFEHNFQKGFEENFEKTFEMIRQVAREEPQQGIREGLLAASERSVAPVTMPAGCRSAPGDGDPHAYGIQPSWRRLATSFQIFVTCLIWPLSKSIT